MSKSSIAASPVVSRTGRSTPIMAGGIAAAAAAASAANAAASTTPSNASNASHHHHHHRLPGSSAGAAGPSASAAAGPSNGQRQQQQQLQLQQQADTSTSAHHHHHHHHHHHGNNTHAHQHGHAGHAPASASTAAAPHPYPPADATMAMGGPISAAEALHNVNSAHHQQPSSHQQHHLAQHSRPPPLHGGAASAAATAAGPNGLVAWPRVASPSVATAHAKSALYHHPQHAPGSAHPASAGHHPSTGVHGVNGDAGATQAAPQAPTNEPHNAAIRGILEHGSALNAEAARAVHFSLERRAAMPTALQQADTETEACYSEIGTIAWNLGDRAKALRAFENALARNPYCLASLQGIARYHYEKANGTNPGAPAGTAAGRPANGSSTAVGGAAGSANGSTAKAQQQAAQAAAAAATASLIEEAYNRVVDYAARALAVDENGAEGEMWSVVGHALLQLGQMPRAYSCYQQAIAKAVRKDDPKLWYGIGILYDRYGSVEHAEEAFASVLKLDPNFHKREEVYFRLGIIYKIQGKADASLECFHYILSNPPEPLKAVDVWYQIGHAHELNRNLGLAKEAYEKVLLTTPDHSKVLQHLGGIHLREGQFHDPDLCIQYVTQSLEHDSHDPFTWYLLGRAFMQKQNYGKAYEAYQQAVYRDGKNPAYWCSIGVLYFNINQYHDALDAYTRAVRIHPFIPEIWQNLGTLYESCHDQLADATDAYQRAVQLEPGNVELLHRLEEVRYAMHHGTEIKTPPPIPQDIMPDSKSWAAVHVDVTGAKPVYLDGKAASRQASPAADGGFGLSTFDPHAPPGGHRYVASPANEFGPSVAGPGPYPGGRNSLGPGANGNRRLSMTRPGSSHAGAYLQQQDYPSDIAPGHPRGYLAPQSQSGLTMASRPSMHSQQSGSSGPHELERGHPGRVHQPGGPSARNSGAAYSYPVGGRHSPAGPLDPNARQAMSPTNSPRTRAIEYEMQQQHQRAAHANDNAYERLARAREAEYYDRDRALAERGGMPRPGPGGPAAGVPLLRGAGQDGEPGLSPTDHRAPSAYSQREYAAQAGLAGGRRTGSPAGRYADERQAAQGRAGPAARGAPPPPAGYYGQDYYTGSQPPPGYGDPRRDPRYAADGRYDDPRERDIERERHLRPHMDEAPRRRAEADSMGKYGGPAGSSASAARNGRRELSPAEYMDREREARRLSGPQHANTIPSSTANAAVPLDHARLEQGIPMLQKPPSDRRKPYGRQPDGLSGSQAPYGHHASSRPAEYESGNGNDDETDMANALIGLAGGALSSAAGTGAAASSGNAKPDRMALYGHKRPLSSHGEGPQKRPRPEEMTI